MEPDFSMKDYVEARFGTDEAIGIMMETTQGDRYPMVEADTMYMKLGDSMPDMRSVFADGSSATVCTNYAIYVLRCLGERVKIYGFANEQNRNCRVVRDELHPGGHDFALVDERYIVDPWIRLVAGSSDQICFDLEEASDRVSAADWYGTRDIWTRMLRAEECARQDQEALAAAPRP